MRLPLLFAAIILAFGFAGCMPSDGDSDARGDGRAHRGDDTGCAGGADADGDGADGCGPRASDCDDADPSVFPGNPEATALQDAIGADDVGGDIVIYGNAR